MKPMPKEVSVGPFANFPFKHNHDKAAGFNLQFVSPVLKEGKRVAKLLKTELENEEDKWKNALIGFVIGDCPGYKQMLNFVSGKWEGISLPQIFLHNDGYFIFKFASQEDMHLIWSQGPYSLNFRPLVLKPWTPNFKMSTTDLTVIPLWVHFPGLPLNCWSADSLSRLGSCIGRPLCSDKVTLEQERISFARICVEVNIKQQRIDEIWYENEHGICVNQKVEFEWWPRFCSKCKKFGHLEEGCSSHRPGPSENKK